MRWALTPLKHLFPRVFESHLLYHKIFNLKGNYIMNNSISYIESRIDTLTKRDAITNVRIINKLKRRLRALKAKQEN